MHVYISRKIYSDDPYLEQKRELYTVSPFGASGFEYFSYGRGLRSDLNPLAPLAITLKMSFAPVT